MNYINEQTKSYPVSERDIRAMNPNTSFPESFIAPEPYAPVFPTPQPEHDQYTHFAREITPVLTDKGHYEQAWEIVERDEPLPRPVPDLRITRLAFRNRFTQAEKVMLELAALDDPTAPMAQRQQSAAIRVYLTDVATSSFIDLADPGARAGVQALEAGGLLAAGRAMVILSEPVAPSERLGTT